MNFEKDLLIIAKKQEQPLDVEYFLKDALDLIYTYKKIPESNMRGDEFRFLSKNDPQKAKELKENKFRKNYFNNVTSALIALKLSSKNEEMNLLWQKLDDINDEIRKSVLVTEEQIDSFDELALKIIKVAEENIK